MVVESRGRRALAERNGELAHRGVLTKACMRGRESMSVPGGGANGVRHRTRRLITQDFRWRCAQGKHPSPSRTRSPHLCGSVKPWAADDTILETVWESRRLPDLKRRKENRDRSECRCEHGGKTASAGMPGFQPVIPRLRRLCIHKDFCLRVQAPAAENHVSAHLLIDRGL